MVAGPLGHNFTVVILHHNEIRESFLEVFLPYCWSNYIWSSLAVMACWL